MNHDRYKYKQSDYQLIYKADPNNPTIPMYPANTHPIPLYMWNIIISAFYNVLADYLKSCKYANKEPTKQNEDDDLLIYIAVYRKCATAKNQSSSLKYYSIIGEESHFLTRFQTSHLMSNHDYLDSYFNYSRFVKMINKAQVEEQRPDQRIPKDIGKLQNMFKKIIEDAINRIFFNRNYAIQLDDLNNITIRTVHLWKHKIINFAKDITSLKHSALEKKIGYTGNFGAKDYRNWFFILCDSGKLYNSFIYYEELIDTIMIPNIDKNTEEISLILHKRLLEKSGYLKQTAMYKTLSELYATIYEKTETSKRVIAERPEKAKIKPEDYYNVFIVRSRDDTYDMDLVKYINYIFECSQEFIEYKTYAVKDLIDKLNLSEQTQFDEAEKRNEIDSFLSKRLSQAKSTSGQNSNNYND